MSIILGGVSTFVEITIRNFLFAIRVSITRRPTRNEHVVEKWYVFGQLQDAGKRELIDTSSFTITLTEPYIVFNKKMLEFRVDRCPTEDKLQQTGF